MNASKTRKAPWIKPLYFIASKLSLKQAHWAGSLVGRLLYFIKNIDYRVAVKNISACFPDLSPAKQQKLVKETLINVGKTAFEIPLVWENKRQWQEKVLVNISGEEQFFLAQQSDKGTIFITPHLGCWEIVGNYIGWYFKGVIFLYKPALYETLNQLILAKRTNFGQRLVTTDNKGVRQMLTTLKQGGSLGILPDQDPGDKGGRLSRFFNVPTYTMTLVARLVKSTQCNLILTAAIRLPESKGFDLIIQKIECEGLDEQGVVDLINQKIEQLVREHPSQYQWTYKRFKNTMKY